MGLGPSIKMTTLHHYRCPVTKRLIEDEDVDFAGIIVDGVSEVCDDKIFTAKRVGDIAKMMRVDGAVVAIDGWGNHHIDFVNVIEQLGIRGIKSVGLSYIGQQGRLVCSNSYVDCIIDFNKSESGYESCVVGQNNLSPIDALKAVAILKNKIKNRGVSIQERDSHMGDLITKKYTVDMAKFGLETKISGKTLFIKKDLSKEFLDEKARKYIKDISIKILSPSDKSCFVNSNLDFSPIAVKKRGELGSGTTLELEGITVMLTGAEEGGFQPSNIGSSQGILKEAVTFDMAGTPKSSDYILHIDFCFCEGEGRSAEGIRKAHEVADLIVQNIRKALLRDSENLPCKTSKHEWICRQEKPRILLVKIVSGLGNMYDTVMFPYEPGGFLGSRDMKASKNLPYVITPLECMDGVIHSLL